MYAVIEREGRRPWTLCYYVQGSHAKALASAMRCKVQEEFLGGRAVFAVCDESKIDGRHRAL